MSFKPVARPIDFSENWYFDAKCFVQLALQVNQKNINEVTEKLSKSVIGLQLRKDNEMLLSERYKKINVDSLPKTIKTCEEACNYISNRIPDISKSLATISANENIIALNINHVCGDGGYLKNLIEKIQNVDIPESGPFPIPLEHFYRKHIDSAKGGYERVDNDTELIRINTTPAKKSVTGLPVKTYPFTIRSSELSAFQNPKRGNLTEALWTSMSLTAMAFNDKISDPGCSTCVNMRHLLDPTVSDRLDVCNNYSSITATGRITSEKMTVREVGKAMRRDFDRRVSEGGLFSYLKALEADRPNIGLPGVGIEISNVGPVKIKEPIEDVHMSISMTSDYVQDVFSALSFSVISDFDNKIIVRSRYGPNKVGEAEALDITRGIEFALRNVDFDIPICDAISEIQRSMKIV